MSGFDKHFLAAAASSGNNTHAGLFVGAAWDTAIFQFVVESVGGGPTVTWKVQGSMDSTTGSDGNWFDVLYVTDSSDSPVTSTRTATAVGAQINVGTRPYKWFRLVTTLNTNVTYRAELYLDR